MPVVRTKPVSPIRNPPTNIPLILLQSVFNVYRIFSSKFKTLKTHTKILALFVAFLNTWWITLLLIPMTLSLATLILVFTGFISGWTILVNQIAISLEQVFGLSFNNGYLQRLYEGTLQTAIKIDALINLYTNMFFKNIYLPWIKPILMLAIRNKALLAPVYTLSKIAINFTCYLGSYLESAGNIISPTWTIYIKRVN
ncbi:hypothetical protein ROZALSC1DRAFT_20227 [Rozella allomycis CSF55]|uniref:Uncharacterized protein n=1 Tax=Rozella allomycis (strain CSF55) TaxID=988480 RepID=A0A4P9YPW1_ROZAC|nr:hypothetical protein ROZALSC1DRAFT_20227 [Rozella allomycis CSF55]